MPEPRQSRAVALGVLGAIVGGALGYAAFFWVARQGFYALVLPGAFMGLTAGFCARTRSTLLAISCGSAALALGLYTEWRFAPFLADSSLKFFLTHVHALKPITLIMVALGAFVSYRLALGRDHKSNFV